MGHPGQEPVALALAVPPSDAGNIRACRRGVGPEAPCRKYVATHLDAERRHGPDVAVERATSLALEPSADCDVAGGDGPVGRIGDGQLTFLGKAPNMLRKSEEASPMVIMTTTIRTE